MLGNLYWFEVLMFIISILIGVLCKVLIVHDLKRDSKPFVFEHYICIVAIEVIFFATVSLFPYSTGTKECNNLFVIKEMQEELVKIHRNQLTSNTVEFITEDKDAFIHNNIAFHGDIKYIKSNENKIEYDVYKRPFRNKKEAKNVKVYYNASDFK